MTVTAPATSAAPLPRSLKVLAIALIVFGSLLTIGTLLKFRQAPTVIGPLIRIVLQLTAVAGGIGLLYLKPSWRMVTLVWAGLVMAAGALSFVSTFTMSRPIPRLAPGPVGNVIIALICFALGFLAYRVLTRPHVQARFARPS